MISYKISEKKYEDCLLSLHIFNGIDPEMEQS